MGKNNISVAIIARNEEKLLPGCLESVKDIASEIVLVDDESSDRTVEIAESFGARIIHNKHSDNFDANKQRAIDACKGEWILLIDADERLSKKLKQELVQLVTMNNNEANDHQKEIIFWKKHLFDRHTRMLQKSHDLDTWSANDPIVAYFFPRKNLFLGKYLTYGGVYPDGVIRFFKNGKAHMDTSDLHKQIIVSGRVGWTEGDLLHLDSPTWGKYYKRWIRYTDFLAEQLQKEKLNKNGITAFDWIFIKPLQWFIMTYILRKGFLDSWQGFLFSLFSSLRFAKAYIKYLSL